MRHILESQQFDTKFIDEIFLVADYLHSIPSTPLRGKIMAALFYEPSTRTRFSFESAMTRLGGNVISTENAKEFSSAAKGETLEDSIRVVSNYADVIVLRHHEVGAAARAATVAGVPIINAGDGAGQHPTQALLDLYTIHKELGRINGIHIAFVGDLKYGRTIRSLTYLLGKYKDVTIHFVSPFALRVGDDIKHYLEKHGVRYIETEKLEPILQTIDVLYQTRIQKERFESEEIYQLYKDVYEINMVLIGQMKETSIIMHPLPRVNEIAVEVDISKQAVYFKQAAYGVSIRMALLQYALEE